MSKDLVCLVSVALVVGPARDKAVAMMVVSTKGRLI